MEFLRDPRRAFRQKSTGSYDDQDVAAEARSGKESYSKAGGVIS
jgi:hypothetical protein